MKTVRFDAGRVWVDVADHLVPNFAVGPIEQVVYFHLIRAAWLTGGGRCLISVKELARRTRLSKDTARRALDRLVGKGALRLLERSYRGHRIAVRLPREIPGCIRRLPRSRDRDLESVNFFANRMYRSAIYRRENGRCFYCLRRLTREGRALDHVVPLFRGGGNSYRNLVASCMDCNVIKRHRPAADFLRRLYHTGQLKASELKARLKALEALAQGKLEPVLRGQRQTHRR